MPVASTSATPPPGNTPRRINGPDHLVTDKSAAERFVFDAQLCDLFGEFAVASYRGCELGSQRLDAATMSSFIVSDLVMLGQVGTTIGFGLMFDTLIVRSFMTPSIATLLGRSTSARARPAKCSPVRTPHRRPGITRPRTPTGDRRVPPTSDSDCAHQP